MRIPRLQLALFAALAAAAPVSTATAQTTEPPALVAAVTVRSLADYTKAAQKFGELAGQPQLGTLAAGLLSQATGGREIQGIDARSPLGIAFFAAGGSVQPAVFVRVSDKRKFGAFFQSVAPAIQQRFGRVPFKLKNDFFFIGPALQFLRETDLPAEGRLLNSRARSDLVSAVLHADRIPESALTSIERMLRPLMKPAARIPGSGPEALMDSLRVAKRFELGVRFDAGERNIVFEMFYAPRAHTEEATVLRTLGRSPAKFAGLVDSAAIGSLLVHSRLTTEARANLLAIIPTSVGGSKPNVLASGDALPSPQQRLLDTLRAEVERGELEGAFSIRGMPPGPLSAVLAWGVAEPSRVEQALVDLFESAKKYGAGSFSSTVTRFRDRPVHRVQFGNEDPKVERIFGRGAAVHWTTTKDAVLFAYGAKSLEALKWSLERKSTPRRSKHLYAPALFTTRVRPWLDIFGPLDRRVESMKSAVRPTDRLFMESSLNGDGMLTRFEIPTGLIRALVKAAK